MALCGVGWPSRFTNQIPVELISLQNFLPHLWTVTMKHILTFPKCHRLCSAPQFTSLGTAYPPLLFVLFPQSFLICGVTYYTTQGLSTVRCVECVSVKSLPHKKSIIYLQIRATSYMPKKALTKSCQSR